MHYSSDAVGVDSDRDDEAGFVVADGRRLEYRWAGGGARAAAIVLLHEGLGSVSLWRNFPARLAEATGLPVLAYSRAGYGRSEPLSGARHVRFMHDEAERALPPLLAHFGIRRPLLVGHSDGASIALLHAARHPTIARGVVALAPHLFVEPVTLAAISAIAARFDDGELARRLARHHADAVATFRGWSDAWLSPDFQAWNIEADVAAIGCPILAMQGTEDEYGTMRQIERVEELAPDVRSIALPGCGHSPHMEAADRVIDEIRGFQATLH
jgi:pimeloyl-ACP methyl ester carboxylesterase